jgi:hypothetical protein
MSGEVSNEGVFSPVFDRDASNGRITTGKKLKRKGGNKQKPNTFCLGVL